MRGGGLGHCEIGHAGLHARDAPSWVEFQDAVQPGQHEQDTAWYRKCTAGQSRARAAGDDRNPESPAGGEHRLHCAGRGRQYDGIRAMAVGSQCVAFVDDAGIRCMQDRVPADGGLQLGNQ
jgi:hypothetical protein